MVLHPSVDPNDSYSDFCYSTSFLPDSMLRPDDIMAMIECRDDEELQESSGEILDKEETVLAVDATRPDDSPLEENPPSDPPSRSLPDWPYAFIPKPEGWLACQPVLPQGNTTKSRDKSALIRARIQKHREKELGWKYWVPGMNSSTEFEI